MKGERPSHGSLHLLRQTVPSTVFPDITLAHGLLHDKPVNPTLDLGKIGFLHQASALVLFFPQIAYVVAKLMEVAK